MADDEKTTDGRAPSSATSPDAQTSFEMNAPSDTGASLSDPASESPPQTSSVFAERELLADRYRIARDLGSGAMGRVYRARDVVVNRDVAIKVLRGSWIDDKDIDPETKERRLKRFKNEATAAGRISSPHVVTVHDVAEHRGTHFIVQGFIDGSRSLHEILNSAWKDGEWLDQRRVCQFLLDAALGLRAAHAVGVVHRDIKPANMLVAEGSDGVERLTLIDFGIALIQKDERLTQMDGGHVIQGTPRFIAPEVVMGGAVGASPEEDGELDARIDFFALGVVFYLALTYKYPFEKFLSAEDLLSALTKEVAAPQRLRPALNPGWALLLEKLYCPYRDGRYLDADELIRDVQLLRHELERCPPAPDAEPVPSMTQKKVTVSAAPKKGGTFLLEDKLEDAASVAGPVSASVTAGHQSNTGSGGSGSLANRALTQAQSFVKIAQLFEHHEGMTLPSLHELSVQSHTEVEQPVLLSEPTRTPASFAPTSSDGEARSDGGVPVSNPSVGGVSEPGAAWAAAAAARASSAGDPLDAEPSELFAPRAAPSAEPFQASSTTVQKFAAFLAGEEEASQEPRPPSEMGSPDQEVPESHRATPVLRGRDDRAKKVVAVVASLVLLIGAGIYLYVSFGGLSKKSPVEVAEVKSDPRELLKVKGRPAVSQADAANLIRGVAYERDVLALQEKQRQEALAQMQAQEEEQGAPVAAIEDVSKPEARPKRQGRRRGRRKSTRASSAPPEVPEPTVSKPEPAAEPAVGQAATIFFRAEATDKAEQALVPTGTRIPARLEVAVDSRAAKNVPARVTKAVKVDGKVVIPKGALVTASATAAKQMVQLQLRNVVVKGKRHPLSGYAVQGGRPGIVARVMRTSDSERQRARGENDALSVGADVAADAVGIVSGTAGRAMRRIGGGQADEVRRQNQPDDPTYLTVRAGTDFEFLVID